MPWESRVIVKNKIKFALDFSIYESRHSPR